MRLANVLFLLLILGSAAFSQTRTQRRPPHPAITQQSSEADDRASIEDLQRRDVAASTSMDVDKLEALWDEEIVAIPPGQAPLVGAPAYKAFLEKYRDQMANFDVLGYQQNWEEVRILGDYAYQWGIIQGAMRPVAGGEEEHYHYNAMRILKKQPSGAWKIYRSIWNEVPQPKAKSNEKTN